MCLEENNQGLEFPLLPWTHNADKFCNSLWTGSISQTGYGLSKIYSDRLSSSYIQFPLQNIQFKKAGAPKYTHTVYVHYQLDTNNENISVCCPLRNTTNCLLLQKFSYATLHFSCTGIWDCVLYVNKNHWQISYKLILKMSVTSNLPLRHASYTSSNTPCNSIHHLKTKQTLNETCNNDA